MSTLAWLALAAIVAACGDDPPDLGAGLDGGVRGGDSGVDDPIADARPATACEQAAQHDDLAWIQTHIFTPSCATASCHAGASPSVGLDLSAGRAHANLVGRRSSTFTAWTRVIPGDAAQSYLVVSLGRAPGPAPRDGFMPIGGAEPLCVEKLELIERWIAAGAQP